MVGSLPNSLKNPLLKFYFFIIFDFLKLNLIDIEKEKKFEEKIPIFIF
jgi:hypothetical protein